MRDSALSGIVLLAVGAGLLVWGLAAADSFSSGASEIFQGAPSNKAMALMALGVIIAGFGLVRLLRRPA